MPPVLRIHNGTGANPPSASGAGPGDGTTSGTKLTGTNASYSGTTVTLDGSPDLTNVVTTGDHVLYLGTSTGRRFFTITGKDNTAKTVTVLETISGTTTGRSWAIGGKLATAGNANVAVLYASTPDIKGGWTGQFDSGHTETFSARWDVYGGGNTTDGPVTWRGEPGAATRPVLTFSGADIVPRAGYMRFKDFDITGTGGATNCFIAVGATLNCEFEKLSISGFSGVLFNFYGNAAYTCTVDGCRMVGGSTAVQVHQNTTVTNCYISGTTSHAIHAQNGNYSGLYIQGNVIASAGGDGIKIDQTRVDGFAGVVISHNTINGSTSDGIEYTGDNDGTGALKVVNNILSNNGGFGVNFVSTLTAAKILARGGLFKGNATYNNTSGACNLSGVLEDGTDGTDPQFTNTGSGNYGIGTNLKALGYPAGGIGPGATTTTYVDPGAAQRQEPAGGTTPAFVRGANTLLRL